MAGPTLCSMPLAGHSFHDHDQKVEIVASSQEAAGSAAVEHPASQNGKEHSFPVFDLEPFLKAQQQASALSAELMQYCQSVAETLRATGCLLVRDPRVQVQDNLSFLNMMERYFEQPAALKMADGADPKWRFMWRVGQRPAQTAFQELNAEPVIPKGFPEWASVMDGWGHKMLAAVETAAAMLAIGFHLPADAFTFRMAYGPHLLAPTGADLKQHNLLQTAYAGFHYDLNFLTIHGKSRFPGLFVWLRDGQRVAVQVICSDATLAAAKKALQAGQSTWRVSSTVFAHVASDQMLRPLACFDSPAARQQYPEMLAGHQVLRNYSKAKLEQALAHGKDNPNFSKYHFVQLPYAKLQNGRLGTYKSQDIGGAVEAALRAGYRHIDCASHYHNEHLIGDAIHRVLKEGVVKREDLFVTSKLWNDDHEPEKVRPALMKTLKDLRLDYIDLFLVHWPFTDQNTEELTPPYQKTWEGMEEVQREGLAKNVGVSNMSIKKMQDVLKYAKVRPAVNQVEVHPYFRNQALIDYCAKEGVHVTAYSSLGTPSSAGHLVKKSAPNPAHDPVIREISKKYNRITHEIIIRWGIQHGTSVLVKSGTPKHIKSNIENTTNFALSDEDYQEISNIQHQLRLLDGYPWLHKVGPYKTFTELWDDDGETEQGRNELINKVYNFVDIPTVTVGDEAEMPLISFGTGPAVENETRWEIKQAIQAGHRHLDITTTRELNEVKEGLQLAFIEQMVTRDQMYITSTVRDVNNIESSVKQSLKDLNLENFDLLLLPVQGMDKSALTKAWEVMESLYKNDVVEAIGLRDPTLGQLVHLITHRQYMDPAVVSVEVHPYHPFEHLVDFCKEQDIFVISHSPSGMETGKSKSEERSKLLTDPAVTSIAYEINKANKQLNQHRLQVVLRWVLQRGCAAVCEAAGTEIDRANVGVFEWELSPKDFDSLSNLKPQ
eukprot:jgi/Astpho2/2047/Aster-00543